MKTFMASPATIDRKWYVVDATDMTLGRLASFRLRWWLKRSYPERKVSKEA